MLCDILVGQSVTGNILVVSGGDIKVRYIFLNDVLLIEATF